MIQASRLTVTRRCAGRGVIRALHDVSLQIRSGDFVLVLGPSGAGKTTLLETLAGLLPLAAGEVRLRLADRECHWGASEQVPAAVRARIGLLFQFPERQVFGRNAREDVGWGLGPTAGLAGTRALERVGIAEPLRSAPLHRLSRGEKRRVALAGLLVRAPEALLLDEPGIGLDAGARALLWEEVRSYREDRGAAVVVATHWPEGLLPHATHVLCLRAGTVTYAGGAAGFRAAAAQEPCLARLLPLADRLRIALDAPSSPPPWTEGWAAAARRWLGDALSDGDFRGGSGR